MPLLHIRPLHAAALSTFCVFTTLGCSPVGATEDIVGSGSDITRESETSDDHDLMIKKTIQKDGTVVASYGGYSVQIEERDKSTPPAVINGLMQVFFRNFGTMADRFDKGTPKKVQWLFEDYDGFAEAGGGRIRFSTRWLKKSPNDFDIVTHEGFHLVQSYENRTETGCPGWAIEGLADYARYTYGLKNEEADWSLPNVEAGNKWTDSYRVTARFFVWVEKRHRSTIMDELHSVLERSAYSDAFWSEKTGKSIQQLWSDYTRDGNIGDAKSDTTTPSPSPTPSTPSSVTVNWKTAGRAGSAYSLDVWKKNGDLVGPCVGVDDLPQQRRSMRFTNWCATPKMSVPLSQVHDFRICTAVGNDWPNATCTDAHWNGTSSSVTITNP